MTLPNIETIGWITRGVLCVILVSVICYLAITGSEIPAMLNTITTSLLTAFILKTTTSTPPFA